MTNHKKERASIVSRNKFSSKHSENRFSNFKKLFKDCFRQSLPYILLPNLEDVGPVYRSEIKLIVIQCKTN
jgi:hypothetical protein